MEKYYNPETDDKMPTWLKVVIVVAALSLFFIV